MRPLRGVVVSVSKYNSIILCENGNKLTTKKTQETGIGVEVEIFIETDTLKIINIRKFIPNLEELEDDYIQIETKKVRENIDDQDYYDRQIRYSPTNQ